MNALSKRRHFTASGLHCGLCKSNHSQDFQHVHIVATGGHTERFPSLLRSLQQEFK